MKRILLVAIITCSVFFTRSVSAQCFERGTSVIELSYKLGIYSDFWQLHQGTGSKHDHAGSNIYGLSYELAVFKWLGVGLQVRFDKYIDSASQKQTVSSFNVPAFFNIHVVHTTHFDLYGGMSVGFSSFTINANDVNATKSSGLGPIFDIHAAPRFYIGSHFGISIPISYTSFSYPKLSWSSNNSATISDWAALSLSGMNIGIGLNYRF